MGGLRVLVTGATGKQGGSVARQLIGRQHAVHALTRKPDSAAAQALAQLGARIVPGSLEDRAALERAMREVDAVFAMSTPFEAGTQAEERQGVTVADAAKAVGLQHLVYTSVASADQKTGIPHFDSKARVEAHIRSLAVPATVLAPAYFMENVVAFSLAQLKDGVYPSPLPADRELGQVALADIGAFAVHVLENRERFLGARIELASESLPGGRCAEILARVSGRPIRYVQIPMDIIRQGMGEDGVKMYAWFQEVGYRIDTASLRREYPHIGWHTYESWARGQDWGRLLG